MNPTANMLIRTALAVLFMPILMRTASEAAVTTKYRLRVEFSSSRRVGFDQDSFRISRDGTRFSIAAYRGYLLTKNRRDDDRYFVQVNDALFGPYVELFFDLRKPHWENPGTLCHLFFTGKKQRIIDSGCCALQHYSKDTALCCYYGCLGWLERPFAPVIRHLQREEYDVIAHGKRLGTYFGNTLCLASVARNGTGYIFSYSIHGKKNTPGSYIEVNGKTFGPYERACETAMSDDGARWGFRFRERGAEYVRINDAVYGPFDSMNELKWTNNLTIRADGKRFAFMYTKSGNDYVQVDDQSIFLRKNQAQLLGLRSISITMRGSSYCLPFRDGTAWQVLHNGRILRGYDYVDAPILSDDGGALAFRYIRNKRVYVYINGKNLGPFDDVIGPHQPSPALAVSNNGSHIFEFQKGKAQYISFNAKQYGPYSYVSDSDISLSLDGSSAACYIGLGKRKEYIWFNGTLLGPVILLRTRNLRVSPDGKTVGYVTNLSDRNQTGKWRERYYIMLNEKKLGPYDAADFTFLENGGTAIAYVRDGHVYLETL